MTGELCGNVRAMSDAAPTRRWPSVCLAVALSALYSACQPAKFSATPLPPATLSPAQAAALQRMNDEAKTAFDGHTWRYEVGAGCVLRVRRSFEGRDDSLRDMAMGNRKIEVVPYTEGFGVKAYARGKGGSEDLFDSMSNAQA